MYTTIRHTCWRIVTMQRVRYEPDAVLFPRHEEDVSVILKYCNEPTYYHHSTRGRKRIYRWGIACQRRYYLSV